MKLKKIVNLCKSSGRLYIYDLLGCQWIGDGAAMYPLFDYPKFTPDTLCAIFEMRADAMDTALKQALPQGINLEDYYDKEYETELVSSEITSFGKSLVPVITRNGTEFLTQSI